MIAFFRGVAVRKRRRLVLRKYVPVQEASYFVLPLAPGLDLFAADRQLGRVDFRQRSFFSKWRKKHPDRAVPFVAGDPALAYGLKNDPGWRMLNACKLTLERVRALRRAARVDGRRSRGARRDRVSQARRSSGST